MPRQPPEFQALSMPVPRVWSFDLLLGGLLIGLLLMLLGTPHRVEGAPTWAAFDVAALAGLAAIVWVGRARPVRTAFWLRLAYVAAILPVAYRQVGLTVVALDRPDAAPALEGLDRAICFGTNPLQALEAISSPALNELMYALYVSHWIYPVIALAAIARRDPATSGRALAVALASLLACYVGYALVPAACPDAHSNFPPAGTPPVYGPPLYRFHADVTGLWAADELRRWMFTFDRTPFTCFPSGHVALTVACAALAARRGVRGRALLIAWGGGITLSTVYLRRHFLIDAIAGTAVALLASATLDRVRRGATAEVTELRASAGPESSA